jgi:Lrp/AsnC family leucine-responsive transcriptional regulator
MAEIKISTLDLKDRKILYELDKNCRQSCSQIGKKVGLSNEVVNYRIKRFEKEKIITHYQVVVNLSKLGITEFKVVLSLQHIDSEKLETILKKVCQIKKAMWVASCRGNWDMIISGEAESLEEINKVKDKILSAFSGFIREKAVAVCFKAEVFNRDFLIKDKTDFDRARVLVNNEPKIKLDGLDLSIIRELAEDGRKSIVDISFKLKESERVINYRIKQLQKKGIITGFRIALNYDKLGINFYKTFFYLENPTEEKLNKLVEYFQAHKNIIHNVESLGNWDLEPEFETYSEKEFDLILQDIKDKFKDLIKRIDIMTISKEHKFVYL